MKDEDSKAVLEAVAILAAEVRDMVDLNSDFATQIIQDLDQPSIDLDNRGEKYVG